MLEKGNFPYFTAEENITTAPETSKEKDVLIFATQYAGQCLRFWYEAIILPAGWAFAWDKSMTNSVVFVWP